ncbi:MAG: DUF2202 domain-containing protein [Magnetococcales bacterium]|nr:DUF2202 domain-containing protein [Magnetococcales bacterium]
MSLLDDPFEKSSPADQNGRGRNNEGSVASRGLFVPAVVGRVLVGAVFAAVFYFLLENKSIIPDSASTSFAPSSAQTVAFQPASPGGLSQAEITSLQFMREEEKMARDVYRAMHQRWGLSLFNSIARSEQKHMDAVRALLVRYQIADPVIDDTVGALQNAKLSATYQTLLKRGEQSVNEALRVGGFIEEVDISDLNEGIKGAQHQDIIQVYQAIRGGSFNHLRAFVHGLELRGQTYSPVIMHQQSLDTIIHSPMEMGPPQVQVMGPR